MTNRRKDSRVRMSRKLKPIPAAFRTDRMRGEGHVASLSSRGLFVASGSLPEPGEFVTVVFSDRSGSKIEVCGIVRWTTDQLPPEKCSKSGFGMYLEFVSDDYREFYEELLTS